MQCKDRKRTKGEQIPIHHQSSLLKNAFEGQFIIIILKNNDRIVVVYRVKILFLQR